MPTCRPSKPPDIHTPISNLPYPIHTKPFMPFKTTQTYAHSQLPCGFSRTLHTHNKNHLISSTSGTLGFQPLVDTFCSPAPMSVEGGSLLLTPTSSWTNRGGREGKTFNQNAQLLPKGPLNKCAWSLAKSSRWWAEKGQDLKSGYWWAPDGAPK